MSLERHEDRDARLGPDFSRRVPLTGQVLGDQDVAWAEPPHGAVPDLDVNRAGEGEHGVPAWCVMPRVGSRRLEASDDDAAVGNQLRGLGLVAARLELGHDLLEMRLAVGAGGCG